METINTELILADLESVQKRLDKARSNMKTGDKKYVHEAEVLQKIHDALDKGLPARSVAFDDADTDYVKGLFLLTTKPVIYATNVGEDDIGSENEHVLKVKDQAKRENAEVITVCAKVEEDLSAMETEEKAEFMEMLGIKESGLDKLIKSGYSLLGLISFLTAGPKEVRAWTITKGTKAPGAAGKIHSDFERGFIRAEVVAFDDLVREGDRNKVKEKGLLRSEGKEYVMKDGDVVEFLFNV
jgi:GTP-binding protein YchF